VTTHFQAKLTKVVVARVKNTAIPGLTLTLSPTYEAALTELASDTGQYFAARFLPLELDLFGVDVDLPPVALAVALAKVNITPPKENTGPTMQFILGAGYCADGARLVARVGQRVAVTLEEIDTEVTVEDVAPAVDERQASFVEDEPTVEPAEEPPADSEPTPPAKPAVSPQDFFKRMADESTGEAAG
jgi:hypothetical protein